MKDLHPLTWWACSWGFWCDAPHQPQGTSSFGHTEISGPSCRSHMMSPSPVSALPSFSVKISCSLSSRALGLSH